MSVSEVAPSRDASGELPTPFRGSPLRGLVVSLQELNRAGGVAEIFRTLVHRGAELTDARAGTWGICAGPERWLFNEYYRDGKWTPLGDLFFEPGAGIPAIVTRTRVPYVSNDPRHDPHVLPHILERFGFHNLVDLPVVDPSGELVGYLAIHDKRGGRRFQTRDVEMLRLLVAAAGAAIANAKALEDRNRAAAALRESEEKFRRIFEASLDAVAINAEDDGRYLDVNARFLELSGFRREDLIGQVPRDLGIWKDPKDLRAVLRLLRDEGHVYNLEADFQMHNGRVISGLFSAARTTLGDHPCIISFVRDVTAQKGLEAQLRHAQKLEAVGRLAAGVAHEINNPLTFVLDHLETLSGSLMSLRETGPGFPGLSELCRAAREAWEGAERVRRIVRDLKTFSRSEGEEERGVLDLAEPLRKALQITRNEIRYRARLVNEIATDVPVVGNDLRLSQVFVNLLINAAQAIPEGRVEENQIRVRCGRRNGMACVEIFDTGTGIAPEHLEHLFDPFFTTKAVGTGTGLGLAICRNIIEAHGGRIGVESTPGRGTSFRIELPLAETRATAMRPRPPRPATVSTSSRRGRVLLIDDEPLVRKAAARMLRAAHDVVEARSGRDALEAISHDPHFDLIVCDLMMADVSGMELFQLLGERHPELAGRVLFMTGGAFTPGAQEFLRRPGVRCIEKPFAPDEFLNLTNELIAA